MTESLTERIRAEINRTVMHPTSTWATLEFADALRAVLDVDHGDDGSPYQRGWIDALNTVTEAIATQLRIDCPCKPGAPRHRHNAGGYATDDRGRTLGTEHDFQGYCNRATGHEGPHAAGRQPDTDSSRMCGAPVALIGDLTNWKPTGILKASNPSAEREPPP